MSWQRGDRSVEVELSRTQGWIERTDPILFGENGEPGMVRTFYEEKSARGQRDKDLKILIRIVLWFLTPTSLGVLLLSILRAAHMVQ